MRQPTQLASRLRDARERAGDDLATEAVKGLGLDRGEYEALQEVKAVVLGELRFEHMDDKDLDKAAWRFTCQSVLDRATDHVPKFVEEYAHEIIDTRCYVPVEYLRVDEERRVGDVRLLPIEADEIPSAQHWFTLDKPVGCVAAIAVSGTSYKLMAARVGNQQSTHFVFWRIALRANPMIHHRQLRFRLGESYAFSEKLTGWQSRPDTAYEATYGGQLVDVAEAQPVFSLPRLPKNRLERKADLAVRWIDRGMMATEPTVALLYYFFALEALLGDTSTKLKAPVLARRRAMLAAAMGSGFSHPSEMYFLYEKVRSAAVHGSEAPEVTEDLADQVGFDVRRALKQYLEFATERGFTNQNQLVKALDEHPEHDNLIAWLRANGGPIWTKYLDSLAAPDPVSHSRSQTSDDSDIAAT